MNTHSLRAAVTSFVFCGVVSLAGSAMGNAGTQMPLSQIQAGTEHTAPSILPPLLNPGFEALTAGSPNNWLQDGNMQVGTPINPPPVNPSTIGSHAAQALTNQLTDSDPEAYHYTTDGTTRATITFDQSTTYVLSAYVWNFARPDPNPGLDTPDLALVELDDVGSALNNANVSLARNGSDGGDAANGYFIYQTFQGSQFPNGAYLDVRGDLDDGDPNPLNPPNDIYAQFDNVAITESANFVQPTMTPEPASLAFIGIAAVLGLRRRK